MRALLRTETGVALAAIERPSAGPNDVLVRVGFAGVCRTDLWAADGKLPTKPRVILGHEASGTVEHVGSHVTRVRQGDRVTVEPFVRDGARCEMLGVDRNGVFAERVAVPETIVHRLPDALSLELGAYVEPVAASLGVVRAPLPRPETNPRALVLGAGRIASLMTRVLSAVGYAAIETRLPSDPVEEEAYDFVVETRATTETLRVALHAVKRGGVIVLKSRDPSLVGLAIGNVVAKEVILAGALQGSFETAIALLASGEVDPSDLVGEIVPLDAWETAFAHARSSEARKILLRLDPEAS